MYAGFAISLRLLKSEQGSVRYRLPNSLIPNKMRRTHDSDGEEQLSMRQRYFLGQMTLLRPWWCCQRSPV